MKKVIVNCQTGQVDVIELSAMEESDRLAEIEEGKQQRIIEHRVEVKRQLIKELTELREMKQNRTLFDDTDIADKQVEVDKLQAKLTSLGNLPIA